MADLTAIRLREVLNYDPESGRFRRRGKHGLRPCPGSVHLSGYVLIRVDCILYRAHRLAWLYMTDAWPDGEVDHVDGARTNNRWANLRIVTHAVNQQNLRGAKANSKVGLLGVDQRGSRFRARIKTEGGRPLYLGSFATAEEAHEAYLLAKRELHEGCTL